MRSTQKTPQSRRWLPWITVFIFFVFQFIVFVFARVVEPFFVSVRQEWTDAVLIALSTAPLCLLWMRSGRGVPKVAKVKLGRMVEALVGVLPWVSLLVLVVTVVVTGVGEQNSRYGDYRMWHRLVYHSWGGGPVISEYVWLPLVWALPLSVGLIQLWSLTLYKDLLSVKGWVSVGVGWLGLLVWMFWCANATPPVFMG